MRGELARTPVADVCRDLAARTASGTLHIDGPGGPAQIEFALGAIVGASAPTPRPRLGDRLVAAGELAHDRLPQVLAAQRSTDVERRLGAALVADGAVDPAVVQHHLRAQVLEALDELMSWRRGTYVFVTSVGAPEVPLALDVATAVQAATERRGRTARPDGFEIELDLEARVPDEPGSARRSSDPSAPARHDPVDAEFLRSLTRLALAPTGEAHRGKATNSSGPG